MPRTESPRIKAFRLGLAKQLPVFPNNKASRQALETKSLGSLLIDYVNWAIRCIAPRERKVVVEVTASDDARWQTLASEIEPLLQKVVDGVDLTPHLSLQPHTRGFTPAASAAGPDVDRWADKDMLLNVMGYHHLHLDAAPYHHMRSDDMLFAQVTRDTFIVVGIFNHRVFELGQESSTTVAERERLYRIFEERMMRGTAPGQVVVPSLIATSGHSLYAVQRSEPKTFTNSPAARMISSRPG